MADATTFYRQFISEIKTLINDLENLDTAQDRMAADSALAAAAADAANAAGRTDLTETDFTNAASAVNQILFTFNSGSPSQKSYLYKLL
jgi:hypothetical protein